ncbi:HAD hydrolase family protein [Lactobacillus selangorensis]|nr:HAD hydrolase family protein [Lactobacillus selangorensis]
MERVSAVIALGNATERVKKYANYVTSAFDQHGIVSALRHFQLI